jgi:hypothetical protein
VTVQEDQKADEQQNLEESAKFVRAALFLKQAEVKLGIPLLNTGSSPQRIEVDSTRRPKRPKRVRTPDQPDYPQQPAPGRPSGPRVRAKMGPHTRRCNVCRHPHRKEIEQEFLRWRSPDHIAQDYKIPDHSSIYRHVHATAEKPSAPHSNQLSNAPNLSGLPLPPWSKPFTPTPTSTKTANGSTIPPSTP